ncbi:hypothetical protein [Geothermobacter ehrlichii]|nr:hypothetical protein [Geothermobacter ehrlichii]
MAKNMDRQNFIAGKCSALHRPLPEGDLQMKKIAQTSLPRQK